MHQYKLLRDLLDLTISDRVDLFKKKLKKANLFYKTKSKSLKTHDLLKEFIPKF